MKNPQGEIRFTIRLNEQGEWVELGEMSRDGETRAASTTAGGAAARGGRRKNMRARSNSHK